MSGTYPLAGVSIITCTNKPQFIDRIFANYKRQQWQSKELIVVINNDTIPISRYRRKARLLNLNQIHIFHMPERESLGRCLNFAIRKASYPFIAKFDDDEYYGPRYVPDTMRAFNRTKADIIGKRSIYTYLESRRLLILRFPNKENQFVSFIAGGTIFAKRHVFRSVPFADVTLGEDLRFLRACKARGFKIYSTDRYNFVCHRRQNRGNHTWWTTDQYLIRTGKLIATTSNYIPYTIRPNIKRGKKTRG